MRDAVAITCAYSRQHIIQEVLAEVGRVPGNNLANNPGIHPADRAVCISDPVPGSTHDSVAIDTTPVVAILEHGGGAIADRGYQVYGYVTPRKKLKGGELERRRQGIEQAFFASARSDRASNRPY